MKKKLKLIIALLVIIAISVSCFFILKACGVTNIDNLRVVVSNSGGWGIVVFLLLQIICTVLLCFVPGTSMTFITLGVVMFGPNWKTFLLCFSGVILSSITMDLIGRFGGSKLIIKLVGEGDYNDALALVQEKGVVYVPVMYLLPIFPDDAICMICGATKVKWWIHYIEIVLCRGIGCATIVFGINILPQDLIDNLTAFNWEFIFANIWQYITMITVLVFWVIVLLFIARKVDKMLAKHMKMKQKENNEDERITE